MQFRIDISYQLRFNNNVSPNTSCVQNIYQHVQEKVLRYVSFIIAVILLFLCFGGKVFIYVTKI